jgi:feruloyl esterase
MWRKLVAFMRFDGPVSLGRPLSPAARPRPATTPLAEAGFSPNPGNLRLFQFIPPGLTPGAPLVVLLHGCGQTASGYDTGTGWSTLARQHGFALIAAEQKAANNPNTCFNWFNPEDITRGSGEAASIAAMIESTVAAHGLDSSRVFITGLSAGGAMAAAMLALYPGLFAGGAIIAGLPFGAAANVREALEAMRLPPLRTPRQWGDAARASGNAPTHWPRVSIWHGDLDTTVNILNAQALAAQWADLHGLALTAARQERRDGALRLSWGDHLEVVTVPGLGHGAPIDARDLGEAAPFILDVGVSSTRRIAQFWGLDAETARPAAATARIERVLAPQAVNRTMESVIRRALRAAGLVK